MPLKQYICETEFQGKRFRECSMVHWIGCKHENEIIWGNLYNIFCYLVFFVQHFENVINCIKLLLFQRSQVGIFNQPTVYLAFDKEWNIYHIVYLPYTYSSITCREFFFLSSMRKQNILYNIMCSFQWLLSLMDYIKAMNIQK